jgi:hypothetical protein
MSFLSSPRALGLLLAADGLCCLALGLGALLLPSPLAALFGLSSSVLVWSGVILLASAGLIALAIQQLPGATLLVWLVILGNFGWVLASVLLLVTAWSALTSVGVSLILAQALATFILTEGEVMALRARQALAA